MDSNRLDPITKLNQGLNYLLLLLVAGVVVVGLGKHSQAINTNGIVNESQKLAIETAIRTGAKTYSYQTSFIPGIGDAKAIQNYKNSVLAQVKQ